MMQPQFEVMNGYAWKYVGLVDTVVRAAVHPAQAPNRGIFLREPI